MSDEQHCRLCDSKTHVVVNIRFKAVPVCDECCLTITKQTVASLHVEFSMMQGMTEIRSNRD